MEENQRLVRSLVFESEITCTYGYKNSHILNGFDIFGAAVNCGKENKDFEATLLILLGQIRSMADMEIFKANNDEEGLKQTGLYGIIYSHLGGSGSSNIYRDESSKNKLFSKIRSWEPYLTENYNPGWNYKYYSKIQEYSETIDTLKRHRIKQLERYSLIINDDEYYRAQQELNKLQSKNPNGFISGTEDFEKSQKLILKMQDIAAKAPEIEIEERKPFEFEPTPDAEYEQVFVGFNGPRNGKNYVWESEVGVRKSWLSDALNENELNKIISKIDFETHILIGFTVGERQNITGRVYITDASYNKIYDSYSISGAVGVTRSECNQAHKKSYAFALAIALKPPYVPLHPNYSITNFPDDCVPVKSGIPNG